MKRRTPPPPWKRPSRLLWFALAVAGSCWLILHMPADARRMRAAPPVSAALDARADAPESSGASASRRAGPAPQATPDARRAAPDVNPAAPDAPTALRAGEARSHGTRTAHASDAEKIFMKLKTFGRLFAIVGLASFLGGMMEARRWHMALARLMGRLSRMARLPEIVGLAMPTALCSNAAANSILVSSHAEGRIRTSALIAGGMANSYLAYVSHSIRVMYPVIGAIGLPGALYFGVQFTGGLFVLACVLLWNRRYVSGHGGTACVDPPKADAAPLPWSGAVGMAAVRSLSLLFRMVCMTLPLMLGIEWLLKNGAFAFWEDALPHTAAELFPAELLSVVAAQMGGLVQSSAVAANLRAEGLIGDAQILLAMLVGSAVGNPFRTLRRNLPSALGIFPVPVALTIVLGMQLSRFLVTLAGIAGVVAVMRYMS